MQTVHLKKRPTASIRTITGSDLMTDEERSFRREQNDMYSIAEDQAFLPLPGDPKQMTVAQFEAKIKKELHPNFIVLYNPYKSQKHMIEGHHMGFYCPERKMIAPLCRVGISGDNVIKDVVAGGVESFVGSHTGRLKQKAVISRGWIAAYEACRQFLLDYKKRGILKDSRLITPEEFFVFKNEVPEVKDEAKIFEEAKIIKQQYEERLNAAAQYVKTFMPEV